MSVEDQFEGDERALLTRIHELLDVRMKDKRKRYVHSLGVAETALHLAEVYGVNRFDAAAAGLIHDEQVWLDMLASRNVTSHVYDDTQAAQVVSAIRDRYISPLTELAQFYQAD